MKDEPKEVKAKSSIWDGVKIGCGLYRRSVVLMHERYEEAILLALRLRGGRAWRQDVLSFVSWYLRPEGDWEKATDNARYRLANNKDMIVPCRRREQRSWWELTSLGKTRAKEAN